jgi:thioredoxin:protein disulfide reductase
VPQALQGRLTQWSNGVQGGRYVGVFVMGGLSALIVGPCIGPPLAGALLYIGQTQDVLLGGVALYAMALGMSVPLLLIGLSAGALLPRAGGWMRHVKHFFGAMLLGAALWMVAPVIPPWSLMLLVAALMLAVGVYLGAFEPLHGHPTPGRAITKGLGLVLAVLAALLLLGVVSGGRSLLQPLAHWSAASGNLLPGARAAVVGGSPNAALAFQPVRSVDELAQAVRASTRPVVVDFYADWCVACKELEAFTFTDAAVREQLAGMTLLRVDLTANNVLDQALLRHYQLFGPPALLFFPPGGAELSGSRVIGFMGADKFSAHLGRMAPLLRPAAKS